MKRALNALKITSLIIITVALFVLAGYILYCVTSKYIPKQRPTLMEPFSKSYNLSNVIPRPIENITIDFSDYPIKINDTTSTNFSERTCKSYSYYEATKQEGGNIEIHFSWESTKIENWYSHYITIGTSDKKYISSSYILHNGDYEYTHMPSCYYSYNITNLLLDNYNKRIYEIEFIVINFLNSDTLLFSKYSFYYQTNYGLAINSDNITYEYFGGYLDQILHDEYLSNEGCYCPLEEYHLT